MKKFLMFTLAAMAAFTFTASDAEARPHTHRKFIGYTRGGDAMYRVTYVAGYNRWTKRPIYKTRIEVVPTRSHAHKWDKKGHGPVKKKPGRPAPKRHRH